MFSHIAQQPNKDRFCVATRLTVTLVLFLGPVFFSLWPFWSLNYGKELLFQFLAMMLVTFFIAGAIAGGAWRSDLTSLGKPLRLPLLLMLASFVLAIVLGDAPFEARTTFLDVILGFLFALILAQAFRERAIKPVPVLLVVILGAVLNAASVGTSGYYYYYRKDDAGEESRTRRTSRTVKNAVQGLIRRVTNGRLGQGMR